jgi:hypothetical protein
MTELNKNSFFFYFMKKTGGLYDPLHLIKVIEALKEWLPDGVGFPETGYSMDAYELGQREYKEFIMENLK